MAGKRLHKGIDWDKVKNDYVTSNASYRDLAKKYRVSQSYVSKLAKEGGWVEARKDYRAKVAQEGADRSREAGANALGSLYSAAAKLAGQADRLAQDGELSPHDLKYMAQALKAMTDSIRDLWDLPNLATRHRMDLEAAQIQAILDKAKADQDKANGGGVEIVITGGGPEMAE